jgi:hypothetical protein
VNFTTYFLFNELSHSPLHPLFSFDWALSANAVNRGKNNWEIVDNEYSNEETIRESIVDYDTKTIFDYNINSLPCLKTAVCQFLKSNKLGNYNTNCNSTF